MATTTAVLSAPTRATVGTRRTVALVVAGIVVAGIATSIVALTASALGAGFPPLMPAVYLPFVALGLIAAVVGWRIVRARSRRPFAVLRVLVPVLLVLSFVPDTVLMITRFIPGTTLTGGLALSVMHVIVAAVAVPLAQRIAPVSRRDDVA